MRQHGGGCCSPGLGCVLLLTADGDAAAAGLLGSRRGGRQPGRWCAAVTAVVECDKGGLGAVVAAWGSSAWLLVWTVRRGGDRL